MSGSAGALVGQKVRQFPGILGWSSVIRSGAELLGPLTDSNVSVFHDTNLPVSQWTSEVANITPADINFTNSLLGSKTPAGPGGYTFRVRS